jgi:dipeptidyl aminopeptidase/acylaminoacyl peptidase
MPAPTDAWVQISAAVSPAFSRDGTTLYHLRGSGLPQVWAMNLDGSNARQIASHDEKVAFLRRAPKDDRLLWGIDAGGDECTQFWLMEPGGRPRPLTSTPTVMHEVGAFSPDGTMLSFSANDRDRAFYDIKIMGLATGAQRLLMQGPGIVRTPSWRPDGAALAVVYDHATSDQRLFIVDVATGAATQVPNTEVRYAGVRWSQGQLSGLTDAGGSDFMRLCRIDAATGAVEVIYEAPGCDVESWAFSAESGLLATIENDRGYAILRVGKPGEDRPAVTGLPEGIVADLAWSADGTKLAFSAQGPTSPSGIYLWEAGRARAVWTPPVVPELPDFIPMTLVGWTAPDGLAIPGFYALPKTPKPQAGYPAVVWVHGGPSGQTRANFRADIQLLLDQGFAVMMPNIRGSTGYGRAYMEADELELRPACLDDLAAGRAWLASQPEIDAERIGIMGQSYGGWVVLAAVTLQPELWKSAVNYYGIADFVTLLERTGPFRRNHRAREYGFPGEHDHVFEKISPIRHVDKVVAPLLVLHGNRDPRVPMHESETFVQAMEERQKKVIYERFEYAGHGFIRPDHRRRVYAAITAHFSEYL